MQAKDGIPLVSYLFLAFMFLTLLMKRRIKLRPDRQEKLDALLQRKGKLVRIFVTGGTVVFGTLVIVVVVDYWMHRS
jgi:hypothetical protein